MARYGLVRTSFCTYRAGFMLIRRNGPRHWLVGHADRPLMPGFFSIRFRRLRDAAEFARKAVPEPIDDFPDPTMPKFLRRMAWPKSVHNSTTR